MALTRLNKSDIVSTDVWSEALRIATDQVRVNVIDGQPWFLAKDVAAALGIVNTSQALFDLREDEKTMLNIGLPGRPPSFVNEPGLYALISKSRKPEAEVFKRWVTSEVLPTIRKTGAYVDPASTLAQKIAEGVQRLDSPSDLVICRITPIDE